MAASRRLQVGAGASLLGQEDLPFLKSRRWNFYVKSVLSCQDKPCPPSCCWLRTCRVWCVPPSGLPNSSFCEASFSHSQLHGGKVAATAPGITATIEDGRGGRAPSMSFIREAGRQTSLEAPCGAPQGPSSLRTTPQVPVGKGGRVWSRFPGQGTSVTGEA